MQTEKCFFSAEICWENPKEMISASQNFAFLQNPAKFGLQILTRVATTLFSIRHRLSWFQIVVEQKNILIPFNIRLAWG